MNTAIYLIYAFSLVMVGFIVFRIIVRRDYMRKGRTTVTSATLELFISIAYMAFPYTYLMPDWYLLPSAGIPPIRRGIALALIVVGLALTMFSMFFVLGIKRSMGWKVDRLVTSGPYRLSRNPQLVTFILVIIGVMVYWPSWYQVGWLALYAIIFHMMVVTEEEHLRNIYNKVYKEYCSNVPRYIGHLCKLELGEKG